MVVYFDGSFGSSLLWMGLEIFCYLLVGGKMVDLFGKLQRWIIRF